MTAGDVITAVTAAVLLATLGVIYRQLQADKQQLQEGRRQTEMLALSLNHAAYESLARARIVLLKDDPSLLAWYLSSRGYPSHADPLKNKKTLYLLMKLDGYERNIINEFTGHGETSSTAAWQNALISDTALPEFAAMWSIAKRYYAKPLVEKIDETRRLSASTAPKKA